MSYYQENEENSHFEMFEEMFHQQFEELLGYIREYQFIKIEQWFEEQLRSADVRTIKYTAKVLRQDTRFWDDFAELLPEEEKRAILLKQRHLAMLKYFPFNEQLKMVCSSMEDSFDCDYVNNMDWKNIDNTDLSILHTLTTSLFQKEHFEIIDVIIKQSDIDILKLKSEDFYSYYYDNLEMWTKGDVYVFEQKKVPADYFEWHPYHCIMLDYSAKKEQYLIDKGIDIPNQTLFKQFSSIFENYYESASEFEQELFKLKIKQYQTFLAYRKLEYEIENNLDIDTQKSCMHSQNLTLKI